MNKKMLLKIKRVFDLKDKLITKKVVYPLLDEMTFKDYTTVHGLSYAQGMVDDKPYQKCDKAELFYIATSMQSGTMIPGGKDGKDFEHPILSSWETPLSNGVTEIPVIPVDRQAVSRQWRNNKNDRYQICWCLAGCAYNCDRPDNDSIYLAVIIRNSDSKPVTSKFCCKDGGSLLTHMVKLRKKLMRG